MSEGVKSILSPMLAPLFRIEWWVRQAALGEDVVPDVNCMLTVSRGSRSGIDGREEEDRREGNGRMALRIERSTREDELSATII